MGAAAPNGALIPEDAANEDLLQLLYLCPVAIAKLNRLGNIMLMNPHGTQLLMPLTQDGELNNLFDIVAPFAPEVREMAMRFTKRAGTICEEHRFLVPQRAEAKGSPVTLSLTMQKLDLDVFVVVVADVTATARREVAIRTSEERLHSVLDGFSEYAICTLDLTGQITSWNTAEERLEGYRSDEVLGRHIDMLAPANGSTASPFKKPLERARRDGGHEFEGWRVRKDGSRFWAHCTISGLAGGADKALLGFSVITRDTTATRRSEDNLRLLASTDPLTGALNRRAFFEAAQIEQTRCHRSKETIAILLVDIDHFKTINDQHGHEIGDVVLQRVVTEAQTQIRATDVLGRIGGEEFALVLTTPNGIMDGVATAERIRTRLAALVILVSTAQLRLTVSIGVAEATGDAIEIKEMIRLADRAMYAAKRAGRNRTVAASDEIAAEVL